MVITETRQRSAHPDVEKQEAEYFENKPEYRKQGLHHRAAEGRQQVAEGTRPAAEEEYGGHAADRNHVGVFRHEEHGEFHGAVFGVIAGHQFGFGFGQVEGGAVGFRVRGH